MTYSKEQLKNALDNAHEAWEDSVIYQAACDHLKHMEGMTGDKQAALDSLEEIMEHGYLRGDPFADEQAAIIRAFIEAKPKCMAGESKGALDALSTLVHYAKQELTEKTATRLGKTIRAALEARPEGGKDFGLGNVETATRLAEEDRIKMDEKSDDFLMPENIRRIPWEADSPGGVAFDLGGRSYAFEIPKEVTK